MTAVHEELARVVTALPVDRARQVLNFARILAALPAGADYQDDWSEEDLREFSAESMRQFDLEHPEDEGYDDLVPR